MKNLRIKKIYNLILLISFVISIFILNSNLLQAQTNDPNSNKNSSTESKQSSQSIDNSADNTNSSSPEGATGSETGLVKCGVSRDCTICDIFILVRDIFNFALGLLAALAVLSIVIGGFYVVTSAGDSGRVSEGYSIITNAVIGLLLVMSSFLLFSFVLVALGFQSANFSAIFDFQEGKIFSVKCDNASAFNDRGTDGGGVATPPGGTGPITCKNSECLAKNPQLKSQIEKSAAKYGIESNILLAIIDEGEGCNPSVTAACSRSYNDADCSAGYTQCTPDIRAKFTGISDPKSSLDKIRSDLATDIDCGAWIIKQNAGICPLSDVRRVAACYNAGPTGGCGTRNYCERVLQYYKGC